MKTEIKNVAELPLVLRVEDIAKIMNISRVTAYNLVHSKNFPCKLAGRRITIPRDAFFNWLNGTNSCSISAEPKTEMQDSSANPTNSEGEISDGRQERKQ